jgi:hypothetical protein
MSNRTDPVDFHRILVKFIKFLNLPWSARKQATVLWCSTEAEYKALADPECSLRTWCQTASGPLFMV